jgi:hypothetical protein
MKVVSCDLSQALHEDCSCAHAASGVHAAGAAGLWSVEARRPAGLALRSDRL